LPLHPADDIVGKNFLEEGAMSTVLELYEKLKPKLGEEEARALLEFVEASVERRAATKEDLLRTEGAFKEDLLRTEVALKEEMARLDQNLREEITRLDQKLREEITRLDQKLREEITRLDQKLREEITRLDQKIESVKVEITAVKADLIKWAFGFWIGNIAVLSGIMFALLRAFAGK
jgi:phosphoglycerate-specific signal transduction histidine kinase